jgi:hypothetical protein
MREGAHVTWTSLFISVRNSTLYMPSKAGLSWAQVEAIVSINAEDDGLDRARAVSRDGEERHWTPQHGWEALPEIPQAEVMTGLEGRRIAADPVREWMPGTDFLGYGIILHGVGEDYRCRFPTQVGGHLDAILTDKEIILLPDVIEMEVIDVEGGHLDKIDVTEAVLNSSVEDISQLRDGPADANARILHQEAPLKEIFASLGTDEIKVVAEIADYFSIASTVDLGSGQAMVSESDLKGLLEVYDQARVVHEFVKSQNNEIKFNTL